MNEIDLLNPVTEVKIGNETIKVSELNWLDAVSFLKQLATKAGQFTNEQGQLVITPEKLTEVVSSAGDLSTWLVKKATDKDDDFLKNVSFSDGLTLLDAALSRNLRPDFFAKLRLIGDRVKAVIAKSSPSSTSSSGKATPEQT